MTLFHPNKYSTLTPVPPYTANTPTPGPTFQYGGSYLCNAVQVFQQQDTATGSPRDELRHYLQSAVETITDIPGWWGVGQYLLESGCILMGPVLHQVSNLEVDCTGLPCHTRLSNPIQMCLQQWRYHRLLQEEQVTANHLQGSSTPEECLSEWTHISNHPGGNLYWGVLKVFRWLQWQGHWFRVD